MNFPRIVIKAHILGLLYMISRKNLDDFPNNNHTMGIIYRL